MTFFDKKAEVVSVELTQYGKYLLGRGKFKPVYYEFIDSDILYDSAYAGLTEDRNNISNRIKSETPSLRPQYVFSGVETKIKALTKAKVLLQNKTAKLVKDEELIENTQVYEKLYYNSMPLGNSTLDTTYPSLSLNLYEAQLSGTNLYKQNNSHIINIPEVVLKNINVSSSILQATDEMLNINNVVSSGNTVDNLNKIFPDNSYILVEDKSVLLQFFQENVKNIGDNFEVEIYTYETDVLGGEVIKQLYFNKSNDLVVDDTTKVEYYFDVINDNNIPKQQLKQVKTKKQEQVFKINK
jgi:hypothetical protein